jgi:TorA maturation chaperone TorD
MMCETLPEATPAAGLADLWATLGRAFLPPLEPNHWRALHADLPLDLADWRRALALDAAPAPDGLLTALAAYPEHEPLLVHYSSLFYSPPIRVHLNLGIYLDGALNGPAMDALDRWHAAYGLDRSAAFHDQTDHLTAMLEFLAHICRVDEPRLAAEFAHTFLLPALPGLIRAMEREGAFASPYLWLLRFASAALARAYPPPPAQSGAPAKPRYRERPIGEGWRRCARCAKPIASEGELRVMEKALQEAGLPSDHLAFCPDCRDLRGGSPGIGIST